MSIEELFNSELFDEYNMSDKYKDCLGILDIYSRKSYEELYEEILSIWRSWKNKANYCIRAGLDYDHARNIASGVCKTITFEDYIRFKAVGKDYEVLENKFNLTEEEKKVIRRIKYNKKKKEVRE